MGYRNQRDKRQYRESREQVIEHLGGKCMTCGFADHRALQFDHVNGNGLTHLRSQTWRDYHKEILNDKKGKFQLLCANCNWIKKFEKDENPRSARILARQMYQTVTITSSTKSTELNSKTENSEKI